MKMYITHFQSPIGTVEIAGTQKGIVALDFVDQLQPGDVKLPGILHKCVKQIDEYFRGQRRVFCLNLSLHGT
jgi:methylated-DNA-[protein]-cysteine S-methyltransferase